MQIYRQNRCIDRFYGNLILGVEKFIHKLSENSQTSKSSSSRKICPVNVLIARLAVRLKLAIF